MNQMVKNICTCEDHLKTSLQLLNSYDPTRTTTIRNQFAAEMGRRFKWLRSQIRKAVIDRDCFGLKRPATFELPNHREFDFIRDAAKLQAFEQWLNEQVEQGILETFRSPQLGSGVEDAWTNTCGGIWTKSKRTLKKSCKSSGVKMDSNRIETLRSVSPTHSWYCNIDNGNEEIISVAAHSVTKDQPYKVSGRVWVVSGSVSLLSNTTRLPINIASTGTGAWEYLENYFIGIETGTDKIKIVSVGGAAEFYVDDISIMPITSLGGE